ncbi:MAG: phosphotransferase family protein [Microthrixaceae bacterium]
MTSDRDPNSEALAAALTEPLGPVEVHGISRLSGGASRETWSFDAVDADGVVHELVLRRDPPGRPSVPGAIAREAAAMRAARGAGVAVPEVLVDTDDPLVWGGAGMVMRRIAGETLARRILREDRYAPARQRLTAACAASLARLHRVDPATVPGGEVEPAEPVRVLRAIIDAFDEPVPTFEYTLRWLEEHRPDPVGRAVLHGDFRLGNLVVDEDGLASVLDWELTHVGDPVEDLGWLCVRAWRFGAPLAVGGLGTREDLLRSYAASGGATVDAATLRWWEVYGTLRWGAICLTQTAVHLRHELRSVELAAIGRRVCETEWDLLLLVAPDRAELARARRAERAAAASGRDDGRDDEAARDEHALHGRPSAVELVESVREFLTDHVMTGTSGGLSFHARVAANVLGMVERELQEGPAQLARRTTALDDLGVRTERELARALRQGTLQVGNGAVLDVLAEGVVDRVGVANPRYLDLPS